MSNIFFISDTHFQHHNIVHEFGNRPFSSTQEMDEKMIENWNSVVKPGDKIYHLGDVTFGNKDNYIGSIHRRLSGRKRLVLGNHDDVKFLAPYFEKVLLWRKFDDLGLLLTHVPVHDSVLKEGRFKINTINVHGHIHEKPAPTKKHFCVSVEQINYTPIALEDLQHALQSYR